MANTLLHCNVCGKSYAESTDDHWRKEHHKKPSAVANQVGGTHYKDFAIQPVEFIHANDIGFIEGCVIKYICRWRAKGGIQDLEKVKHYVEMLIELEEKNEKD